jgi:hypothetical protein
LFGAAPVGRRFRSWCQLSVANRNILLTYDQRKSLGYDADRE